METDDAIFGLGCLGMLATGVLVVLFSVGAYRSASMLLAGIVCGAILGSVIWRKHG